jgi:spore coat protein U-like protein
MMQVKARWLLCAGCVGLVVAASPVAAQTVSCTVAATPMAFGGYDPSSPTALGPVTSTISAQCSVPPGSGNVSGFALSVALSTGASGSYAARRMSSSPPGSSVRYNIYTSAAPVAIWGDGSGGSVTVPMTFPKLTPGQGGRQSALAYGFVPPLQDVAVANYADTIMVIATW